VDEISFSSIDADECLWLERGFEELEVWEVVREMNGDKAPGPDDFSMAFFQQCWGVLSRFTGSGLFRKPFGFRVT
jgi:hypothetical protein